MSWWRGRSRVHDGQNTQEVTVNDDKKELKIRNGNRWAVRLYVVCMCACILCIFFSLSLFVCCCTTDGFSLAQVKYLVRRLVTVYGYLMAWHMTLSRFVSTWCDDVTSRDVMTSHRWKTRCSRCVRMRSEIRYVSSWRTTATYYASSVSGMTARWTSSEIYDRLSSIAQHYQHSVIRHRLLICLFNI